SPPRRPPSCRRHSAVACTTGPRSRRWTRGELSVSTVAAVTDTHATHAVEPAESPLTPESWGKLGMWIFLAADARTVGALLAGYGALRYGDPSWPRPSSILGIPLTAFMTFLLICSSVTMVEALAGIRQGNRAKFARFLFLTILGGAMFL